jgi:thioredoxin 1
MEKVVTKDFKELIAQGCTLVDFYADWCGPCKMLAPVLEELEPEYPEIRFVRVNVDEEDELAAEYRIMSIPFVALFKDGEKVATMVGYHGKADVEEFLSQVK